MRILALDHGTVRVGVALSDELKMIASPLEFIPAEPWDAFLQRLQQIIVEKQVERILVGMPRNMDGSDGGGKSARVPRAVARRYYCADPDRGRTVVFGPRAKASPAGRCEIEATAREGGPDGRRRPAPKLPRQLELTTETRRHGDEIQF